MIPIPLDRLPDNYDEEWPELSEMIGASLDWSCARHGVEDAPDLETAARRLEAAIPAFVSTLNAEHFEVYKAYKKKSPDA